MRVYLPVILATVFIGWVLYIWLIKKDIKNHRGDIAGGFIFLAVWGLIYLWMFMS